jgi:protein TIF31
MERERSHMFVYNSIFFSFAVDSLETVPPARLHPSGARGRALLCRQQCIKRAHNPYGTVRESLVARGVVQLPKGAGGDEATYQSANNDIIGIAALNGIDVVGLHTLATALIDYRGFRIIAQVGSASLRCPCGWSLCRAP